MIKFVTRLLMFSSAFLFGACGSQVGSAQRNDVPENIQSSRPNIILIVVDDAGYADFGFMGNQDLQTPHIDSLAQQGVVFSDAHVSATVCAPSRAGMLTGKYQQRFGFEANGTGYGDSGDIGLSDEVETLAEVFQQNGYATIAIGKWHLGGSASDHPNQRGFDEFYGFLGGGRSYFPLENPSPSQMLQKNGQQIRFQGYLTDVLGERSAAFVEENSAQPFFMYLAYNAVHTPMEAKQVDLDRFEGHPRQTLAAMTWSLDENIGKLRLTLRSLGLLENTLIFFISDNGGATNNHSSNGTLKGWKGNKFEGGQRVPFFLTWPEAIHADQAFEGLSSSLDIFCTAVAAAGIKQGVPAVLDGVNLLPYLKGEKTGDPHQALFWRKLEESAVRMGDYKLIQLEAFGSVMYDLASDLGETTDLARQDSLNFQRLQAQYTHWETEMMEPLWLESPDWMEVTYHIQQRLMQNQEVLYKSPAEKDTAHSH